VLRQALRKSAVHNATRNRGFGWSVLSVCHAVTAERPLQAGACSGVPPPQCRKARTPRRWTQHLCPASCASRQTRRTHARPSPPLRLAAGQPAEQAEPVSAAAAASLGGAAASPAAEQPTGEDDRRWVDRDAAGDADDADGGQEQPREDAAAGAPASEAPSAAASPDLSSPPPVAASPAPVSRLDFGAGPASQAAAPASCAPRSFADTAL